MSRQIALSFILPCYNVEKYISECIDSLLNQDIPKDQYEIICVNDCSPDRTRDIIVEYQKYYPNILLIDHEINKKQGGARNTGLLAARGEYIWYVDPDDYISQNCLNKLLGLCLENKLDVLLFDYITLSESDIFAKSNLSLSNSSFIRNGLEMANSFENIDSIYILSICSRIYCHDYLFSKCFSFPENMVFEDLAYSLNTFLKAEKVQVISDIGYIYRIHQNSTINSKNKYGSSHLFQACILCGELIVNLSKEIADNKVSSFLLEGGIYRLNSFTKDLIKKNKSEIIKFYQLIDSSKLIIDSCYFYLKPFNRLIVSSVFFRIIIILISPFYKILANLRNGYNRIIN